ncbi:MAG TPA: class I SAM-dependent methyltransferase [Candidatus Sumerlaeota bacterium]|nr:class I SAM-dependent methyltransferase [Candidatus Sumerlaeota bacterium]HPS00612.1 class I SAM-dependent methyltransferase [Candidatus Sumerlaeota bacterium]
METSIYLSGQYLRNNPDYHVVDSRWKARHILNMLKRQNLSVASVCEVGCGAGEILHQLQLALPPETRFSGFEISPQAFEICQSRQNERLIFHCEDFLTQEIEPFDLLLCLDVFEHVEDYLGFLRRLRTRARDKIFHIPLDMSALSVLVGSTILKRRKKIGHLHYFMKDTALLTLQDAGYEIVDYFYTPVAIEQKKGLKSCLLRPFRQVLFRLNPDLAARLLGGFSLLVLAR